mgnify:CR=1 FL=1
MIREERNPYRTLFILTLLILLVLIVIVVYAFAIKPTIQGYVINKQVEASDFIVGTIFNQVKQQGFVQLTYMNESVILVPYTPPQK